MAMSNNLTLLNRFGRNLLLIKIPNENVPAGRDILLKMSELVARSTARWWGLTLFF